MKPGDVLECRTCGARSLPLHTTGGRRWEDGGALVCTWPDATIATGRHQIVVGAAPVRGICLGCRYRELAGAPAAAPGSGAALPAPPPLAAAPTEAPPPPAEASPLDRYEALAEAFRRETGLLAPGKDAPPSCPGPSIEERSERWRTWCAERARAAAPPKPTPKPRVQLGLF